MLYWGEESWQMHGLFGKCIKRIIKMVLVIALCIPMFGCVSMLYSRDNMPVDQKNKNTLWVSEWPKVYIEVDDNQNAIAKIQFQEGEKESEVVFDNVNGVYFVPMYYDISKYQAKTKDFRELSYFSGECKFYRDKMVVKIEEDRIFNGEYDEITFIKEPLD